MSNNKDDKQPTAKIFRKPIHDKATRKVSALPNLIKKSERPDGAKAAKVEEAGTVETTKVSKIEEESMGNMAVEFEISDAGLFDDVFDD